MQPAKILIIRFSSIGDIVLTTPVLRQLREHLVDGSVIHFLTKPQYAHILEANPRVDQVISLKEDINATCEDLKKENYDYVIDLHKNLRSAIVKRQLNVLSFTLDKKNTHKWKLVNLPRYSKPVDHIVKRYLFTARSFGCTVDGLGLEYYIPEGLTLPGDSLPEQPYIAWVLGGAHQGKKLTLKKNLSLLEKTSIPVVLLGGSDEEQMALELSQLKHVRSLAGALTLDQSAIVMKESQLVVSGDTGLMHIATALGKTIISLWGCTTPSLGMYPYLPESNSVMLEPLDRKKRPCSKLGNRCKYGWENQCTDKIDEKELLALIQQRTSN